jgi:hypothetical protein
VLGIIYENSSLFLKLYHAIMQNGIELNKILDIVKNSNRFWKSKNGYADKEK